MADGSSSGSQDPSLSPPARLRLGSGPSDSGWDRVLQTAAGIGSFRQRLGSGPSDSGWDRVLQTAAGIGSFRQRLGSGPSDSGWDRVREIYRLNDRGEFSQEAVFIVKSTLTGALIGMVYGGVPAARLSREQYIKHSQAEVYSHRIEAVRSVHNAAIRGFLRYGFRWGWRVAAFVGIFNCVSAGLSAYRDKVVVSNFAGAGAVTGGLFRLNLGLHGLIGGAVIGALLGIPAGLLVSGLQTLAGEDLRQHKYKEHRQLHERQLQEWAQRVALTDVVVQEIQEAGHESSEKDVEKISELLGLHETDAPER